MKKLFLATLCLAFCTLSWAGSTLVVVTTTPDLGSIVQAVLGSEGTVHVVARVDQDPHYVQAKPSHMVKLRKADALVYTGLQLEIAWLPKLLEGAHNAKIMAGRPANLDASKAIDTILEVPTGDVDRGMGDIHPDGNPHYLLDPRNGTAVAQWLQVRFSELWPEHEDAFAANTARFTAEMTRSIADWEARANKIGHLKIIANHKQWEYLVSWLGLDLVGYVEDRPGIPPSPRHIGDLTRLISEKKIPVIVKAHYVASQAADRLAERTDAKLIVLPATVTGKPGNTTYAGLFETILNLLEKER